MKPKPLSSLNHFTVPVAIAVPPVDGAATRRGCWATAANRSHCFFAERPPSACLHAKRAQDVAETETLADAGDHGIEARARLLALVLARGGAREVALLGER